MPIYDLSQYLCTPGPAYILQGFGNEICQVQGSGAGNYIYQVKNRAAETRWYDDLFIYLGLDTSQFWDTNDPHIYALYTGARYGSAWVKRYMSVGDVFQRDADVQQYEIDSRKRAAGSGHATSFMTLVAQYPSKMFKVSDYDQRAVTDVIELLFSWDAAGKAKVETYWYARGIGLVGFRDEANGKMSQISAVGPGEVPKRVPVTWFVEPQPPPTEPVVVSPSPTPSPAPTATPTPSPDYPAGTNPVESQVILYGVRLRTLPTIIGTQIRMLAFNERVTVYQQPEIIADGQQWVRVKSSRDEGWSAKSPNGPAFKPAAPAGFALKMPFKRVVITSHFNDSRDYSKINPAKLQLHEGADFTDANAAQYGTDPVIHVGAPCTVVEVGYDAKGYGNFVRVSFGNNWYAYYGHMAEVYVKQGQTLKDLQIIGLMGDTGMADGKHVHVTVQHINAGLPGYVVADVVDPEPLLIAG